MVETLLDGRAGAARPAGLAAIRVVRFKPGHLARLAAREADRREMALLGDPVGRAAQYATLGPAFTGFAGDQVAFCAGAVELWPGVGEAWALTGTPVETHRHAFHRAVLRLIAEHQPGWRCHRLQATVRRGHPAAARWLGRLGFAYEGLMTGYGPDGADYLRFARLTPAVGRGDRP